MTDAWDPEVYGRFAAERSEPFFDLVDLLEPVRGGRVIDLGCGTGALTALLHRQTDAAETLGIDSSASMLDQATAAPGLRFEQGDIADVTEPEAWDIVFANASLQWVGDHPHLLAQLAATIRPGGQLAVQVPANADHPSHTMAAEVAHEAPFLEALGGTVPPDAVLGVLRPEHYAEVLHGLGFVEQHVRLQVYGHVLPSTASVVDWTSGTTLTRFRSKLPADVYDAFVDRYRTRLLEVLGDREPYFYAFKRILFWARRPY